MKLKNIILLVLIFYSLNSFCQPDDKRLIFNELLNTFLDSGIPEQLKLTSEYNKSKALFIEFKNIDKYAEAQTNMIKPQKIYVWYLETLFFYDIEYWLKPLNVSVRDKKAVIQFESCSWEKLDREYYRIKLYYKKGKNGWEIKKVKSLPDKDKCIRYSSNRKDNDLQTLKRK